MRPLDFYDLGVLLAASAGTQAERRKAIGRLYYGLHHELVADIFGTIPQPHRWDAAAGTLCWSGAMVR